MSGMGRTMPDRQRTREEKAMIYESLGMYSTLR